jgi:hypothetical protein
MLKAAPRKGICRPPLSPDAVDWTVMYPEYTGSNDGSSSCIWKVNCAVMLVVAPGPSWRVVEDRVMLTAGVISIVGGNADINLEGFRTYDVAA